MNKTNELPPERLARGENRQTAPTLGVLWEQGGQGAPLHLQESGCAGRGGPGSSLVEGRREREGFTGAGGSGAFGEMPELSVGGAQAARDKGVAGEWKEDEPARARGCLLRFPHRVWELWFHGNFKYTQFYEER